MLTQLYAFALQKSLQLFTVKGSFYYGAAGFGGVGGCGMFLGGAQLVAKVAIIAASNSMPVNFFFIAVCFTVIIQVGC
jgi:hypothetical protein